MKAALRVFVLAAIVAVLGAVLFPLFAQPVLKEKPGLVLDAHGTPVPGKKVQILSKGRLVTRTTDAYGYFDITHDEVVKNLGLAQIWTRSGADPWRIWVYSEKAPLTVECVDGAGKPVDDLTVIFMSDRRQPKGGKVSFGDQAVAMRVDNLLYETTNSALRLKRVDRTVNASGIHMKALFERTAKPAQKRYTMSWDGQKVRFHGAP